MATYNPDENFLYDQIQSLKDQTYKNWICFVVDDCSDAKIFPIIRSCIKDDSRFQIIRNNENIGSILTFEKGLQCVPPGAEYVSLCDQDDIWYPSKLEKMLKCFEDERVSLVHCDLELVDSVGRVISRSCWQKEGRYVPMANAGLLLFRNVVTGCASMFRREVLKTALPFVRSSTGGNPSYYHDVWIALHASLSGQVVALSESLIKYRQHEKNLVGGGRLGKGLHIPSLKERALSLYSSRKNLKHDFVSSLELFGNRSIIEKDLKYIDGLVSLLARGLFYCSRNPMFVKTLGLLLLGGLLYRKREPLV